MLYWRRWVGDWKPETWDGLCVLRASEKRRRSWWTSGNNGDHDQNQSVASNIMLIICKLDRT